MKKLILLYLIFLCGCSYYVADNKYQPHKINSLQSIKILFDLIVDEDVTVDDPRIKSIIYASNRKSYVVITYTNPNADKLANKIAEILTKHNVIVKKPMFIENSKYKNMDPYLRKDDTSAEKVVLDFNKYVVVYIDYMAKKH